MSYFFNSNSSSSSSSIEAATIATTTESIVYDVNDKLNKVEKDIDDVISKIRSIDEQIDKIEVDFIRNENAAFRQEFISRLNKREETLRAQKAEYRSDLQCLRSKEHQLIELKLLNQYAILPKESLGVMKSKLLESEDNSKVNNESRSSTLSNESTTSSKLTNEFNKILNTLPDTKGFENGNPVASEEEENPNGKLVRRFAETNDIFDANNFQYWDYVI